MVKEICRIKVEDGRGRCYDVKETAAFVEVGGCKLLKGSPKLLTTTGLEIRPTSIEGEYRILKLGLVVHEVPSFQPVYRSAGVIASLPMGR